MHGGGFPHLYSTDVDNYDKANDENVKKDENNEEISSVDDTDDDSATEENVLNPNGNNEEAWKIIEELDDD